MSLHSTMLTLVSISMGTGEVILLLLLLAFNKTISLQVLFLFNLVYKTSCSDQSVI